MQLSNEPAEKLAQNLIESGKGVFDSCGFVSGGEFVICISECMEHLLTDISRIGSHGSCDQAREAGLFYAFHCV